MELTFSINYHTNWGESLYIVGNTKELGNEKEDAAIKMDLCGNDSWSCSVNISKSNSPLSYRYIVKNVDGSVKREWGSPRSLSLPSEIKKAIISDRWQTQPFDKHYYSSAFTQGVSLREPKNAPIQYKGGNLIIKVSAPMVAPDEYVAISGSNDVLGKWDIDKAIPMNDANFPQWDACITLNKSDVPFEYKFVILKKETNKVVAWESCDNRIYNNKDVIGKTQVNILSGLVINTNAKHWKGAGVAIPVFSLRSEDDSGVGDFYDLYKMIDWAVETGQNFVQILPINDTTMTHTWTDSYPYNANSTFALHPMFLRVNAIGKLSDETRQQYFDDLAKELNTLQDIDYERVNNAKNQYLRELYAEIGQEVVNTDELKKFVDDNSSWLTPYAAFCVMRDEYQTPDFTQWGEYADYSPAKIKKICDKNSDEINFIYFIQYYLDKQLREVRNYAHKKRVVLKGDIPIGISRTSADAWVNPKLFNMDCQAGAPPDDFSILGQNWGFPTYNWDEMSKDDYAWWKARFKKMAEYFDAYRIDHILGFFRIWQIPMTAVHGLLGTFNPAMPYSEDELRYNYDFWINKDLQTTPFIMDYFIHDFFGEYTDEAKKLYLNDKGYGRYGLKDFVDNQKKVVDYFSNLPSDDKNNKIKEALLGLIDQVLFIEDPTNKNTYHPRISAQFTYIYRSLNDYERWCYDRLYNDFFYHRHNDFWYGKAMRKLPPLINSTDMLVCGEDLGMIPDCVSSVMNSQQILSLEIQRMPKDPKQEFGDTHNYPYLSVCTTSTHDMGGIRLWWEEDREKTQHFYNNMLHEGGTAPYFAEPWICDRIVTLHLESPAMLTILPLQDWLSLHDGLRREDPREEQINVPANSRHYWKYRMHIPLELLLAQTEFNEYLRNKIKQSGR